MILQHTIIAYFISTISQCLSQSVITEQMLIYNCQQVDCIQTQAHTQNAVMVTC